MIGVLVRGDAAPVMPSVVSRNNNTRSAHRLPFHV